MPFQIGWVRAGLAEEAFEQRLEVGELSLNSIFFKDFIYLF